MAYSMCRRSNLGGRSLSHPILDAAESGLQQVCWIELYKIGPGQWSPSTTCRARVCMQAQMFKRSMYAGPTSQTKSKLLHVMWSAKAPSFLASSEDYCSGGTSKAAGLSSFSTVRGSQAGFYAAASSAVHLPFHARPKPCCALHRPGR